ncbi:hypothetical protein HY029_05995 [Candidatus Gottesmanbacteria bacterium]|nr:hypothetical protein [Candidatus Gottesmanbacteria bacterium]
MAKLLKKNFGFSIIEIIIYIGMLSVFIVVLTNIFISTIDIKLESESIAGIEQDGRYLIAKLAYDINRAQSITSPSLGATGNTLQITVNGVNETFTLTNGKIQITKNSSTDDLNGYDSLVSNLTFQRLGNVSGKNNVKISFTISSITQRSKGPETKTFQTTVGIR